MLATSRPARLMAFTTNRNARDPAHVIQEEAQKLFLAKPAKAVPAGKPARINR